MGRPVHVGLDTVRNKEEGGKRVGVQAERGRDGHNSDVEVDKNTSDVQRRLEVVHCRGGRVRSVLVCKPEFFGAQSFGSYRNV